MLSDPAFRQLAIGIVCAIAFAVWMRWPRPCVLDELLGPPRDEDSPEPEEQLLGVKRRVRIRRKARGDAPGETGA